MTRLEENAMRLGLLVFLTVSVTGLPAHAQSKSELRQRVRLELLKPTQDDALVRWEITNTLSTAVYVYDVYLWGPAYHVQREADRDILETTPVAEEAACPPNRFPPVLLLAIGPGKTIKGDFTDDEIRNVAGKAVSMRIAVGADPYSVVDQAKRFMASRCKHSPYDAIVRWGAIVESNVVRLPPDTPPSRTPNEIMKR
jgi:hypothetical protein